MSDQLTDRPTKPGVWFRDGECWRIVSATYEGMPAGGLAAAKWDEGPLRCAVSDLPPGNWSPAVPAASNLDEEIMRFVRDFYPETNHERRMEHFLAEVKELQDEPLPEGRVEEAADCALILFHMMIADGGVPLDAMWRKLRIARDRIETGVKKPRPFAAPVPASRVAELEAENERLRGLILEWDRWDSLDDDGVLEVVVEPFPYEAIKAEARRLAQGTTP